MDPARFSLEPSSIQDPSGSIRISDKYYRMRMGKRMLLMGSLFVGLAVALGAEDGYFNTLSQADNVIIYILGVLFFISCVLMPIRGLTQISRRNIMVINKDITQVEFISTIFGKTALTETVAVEELSPNVQEALHALVHVLRAERPDELETPSSAALFERTMPVRIQVLVAGTLDRLASLTPHDRFVDLPVQIFPEAIVINGEYIDSRLVGLGSFVPVTAPRESKHIHDVRFSMDSGRLERFEVSKRGFVLIFLPAPQLHTDFPRAKEVRLILQPDIGTAESVEQALAQFKKAGAERSRSIEFSILALGRRPFVPDPAEEQLEEEPPIEEDSPDAEQLVS